MFITYDIKLTVTSLSTHAVCRLINICSQSAENHSTKRLYEGREKDGCCDFPHDNY